MLTARENEAKAGSRVLAAVEGRAHRLLIDAKKAHRGIQDALDPDFAIWPAWA